MTIQMKIWDICITPETSLVLLSVHHPQPLVATTDVNYFITPDSFVHIECILLKLASFTQHNVSEIHPCYCVYQ